MYWYQCDSSLAVGQGLPKPLARVRFPAIASAFRFSRILSGCSGTVPSAGTFSVFSPHNGTRADDACGSLEPSGHHPAPLHPSPALPRHHLKPAVVEPHRVAPGLDRRRRPPVVAGEERPEDAGVERARWLPGDAGTLAPSTLPDTHPAVPTFFILRVAPVRQTRASPRRTRRAPRPASLPGIRRRAGRRPCRPSR